jgi:hypothetical protein
MPIEDSIKVVQDMSRRAALEKMLAEDPQDVFLHYALANELVKAGEHAVAWDRFALLHRDFPDYVPARPAPLVNRHWSWPSVSGTCTRRARSAAFSRCCRELGDRDRFA